MEMIFVNISQSKRLWFRLHEESAMQCSEKFCPLNEFMSQCLHNLLWDMQRKALEAVVPDERFLEIVSIYTASLRIVLFSEALPCHSGICPTGSGNKIFLNIFAFI